MQECLARKEHAIVGEEQTKVKSVKSSEVNNYLHQIKFAAATRKAKELLEPSVTLGIQDSLNCGKLNARFIKEVAFIVKFLFGIK